MRDNRSEGQRSEKPQSLCVASPPLASLFTFLPPLELGGATYCAPLAGRTAAELALTLGAGNPTAADISPILALDAGLAIWCVLRSGDDQLRSVDALAAWLAGHWMNVLRWPNILPHACSVARECESALRTLPTLLAQSRVAATLASQLAQHAGKDELAAPVYLAGLVSLSAHWLVDNSVNREEASSVLALPEWLQAATRLAPTEKPPRHSIASFVRLAHALSLADSTAMAVAPWALGKARLPAGFAFDADACDAERTSLVQSYQQPTVGLDKFAQTIERLARLASLEVDFERRLELEKIESLKELAYGAGHEINNPLANISARAQTLIKEEVDPERRRKLASIHTQALRAHEMIAEMMFFARPPQPVLALVELSSLIAELLPSIQSAAAAQQTSVVWAPPEGPIAIQADRAQLAVAVRALTSNALEALQTGGEIRLELSRIETLHATVHSSQSVQIAVVDNGPGIAAEVRRHLFDPFYSGREAGRGLGLGLSKCWRIAQQHGGSLDVECMPGNTRLTITLPA